jgi:pimeloyl-ACP methyl ester carboxylesterase
MGQRSGLARGLNTDGEAARGFIEVGASRLECARWPGQAPTLVLLHEGLGCVSRWKDFPPRVAAATGCAVFAWSRAGYGRSSAVKLPRALDFHTREALDVLPQVLTAAAIEQAILVGHSDGASIALIYCGNVADPRVRGVVALAPHVLTEAKSLATIGEARLDFLATDLRAKLARHHGENVDCAFWGWCDTWLDAGFACWDIRPCLAAIKVPVVTVRGGADPYNTDCHVATIRRECARATRIDLAHAGHAPQFDAPDAVIAAIARLVAECAR